MLKRAMVRQLFVGDSTLLSSFLKALLLFRLPIHGSSSERRCSGGKQRGTASFRCKLQSYVFTFADRLLRATCITNWASSTTHVMHWAPAFRAFCSALMSANAIYNTWRATYSMDTSSVSNISVAPPADPLHTSALHLLYSLNQCYKPLSR